MLPGDPITFDAVANATAITYPACYRNTMTGKQLKDVLEDVADNIFNPDPYFQGGGDMVARRRGGLRHRRVEGVRPAHLRPHLPQDRQAAGGRQGLYGRRLGLHRPECGRPAGVETVERYVTDTKAVKIAPNASVKVTGA